MAVSKTTTYWHFLHLLACRARVTYILLLSRLRVRGTLGVGLTQGYLVDDMHILIGPSGGTPLLGSIKIFIQRCSRDSQPNSHLGLFRVDLVE